ncbi:hypothetical protein WR25_23662 [Diploscapter pachys]|uniref:Uncharacterized protein n=1 Tax=Diploscapter pachys TaxID=2018661 RepID=A0A2A2LHV9_9BILA|nr:hypothetical protein WR25_23662 [Diploscapter pachys]
MPFIYSVSFLFSSPSKANVLLIVWQILAALFALIIFNLLKFLDKDSHFVSDAFDTVCLFLLPSYAMATALVKLALHDPLYAEYKDLMAVNPEIAAQIRNTLFAWDNIGKLWVCMLAFGILSSILFMALQFKSIRKQISQIWDIGTTRKGKVDNSKLPLGYCPQFDALLMDLTGRETLEILAQMHGYTRYKDKATMILESVGMKSQADKLVRYYR